MTLLFTILIVLVCILLTLVVLVQNPKGGGLGSAFGGSNAQMFGGVKKTTDFLDRSTWTLAISLFVFVLGMNMVNMGNTSSAPEDDIIEQVEDVAPAVPSDPAPFTEDELPESVNE
jgi:preprotein translocase subunit SecG